MPSTYDALVAREATLEAELAEVQAQIARYFTHSRTVQQQAQPVGEPEGAREQTPKTTEAAAEPALKQP